MRRFLLILAAGLLAAGCTSPGAAGSGGPGSSAGAATASPAAASPATAYDYDHSASALVLRIDSGGGLVPLDFFLDHVPQFSLYGDGTLLMPGPVDAIYPAPLLPSIRTVGLSSAEMQRVLAAADAAGLLGPDASLPLAGVMDAPTTTFTTVVAGHRHVVSAYALGIQGPATDDQAVAAARARLLDFETKSANLGAFLGRDVSGAPAYVPASMRIFAAPFDPATDTAGVTRTTATWPLASDPAAGATTGRGGQYHCTAVSGAELAAFIQVAAEANALTIWVAPSGRYTLLVRPNLPDESGCGAVDS